MTQAHCPDCKDPVRMPPVETSTEVDVRCPWCGGCRKLSEYANQLPPALQVIGVEADPNEVAYANEFANMAQESPVSQAPSFDVPISDEDVASSYREPDPGLEPIGFEQSAAGIQPRRSRRHKPSIFKMLIQWFGGGALGIGIALAILYFGFPNKYPKFLPFQPSTGQPSGQSDYNQEFVPRGRERESSNFVSSNENGKLLESIKLPTGEDEVIDEVVEQDDTDPSPNQSQIENVPPTLSPFDERIENATAALERAVASEQQDQKRNTARLYRALAELGETTAENRTIQRRKRASSFLKKTAASDVIEMLEELVPVWLGASTRVSDGIVLIGTIGVKTTPQARSGYSSIPLEWNQNDTTPITIFGLTNDLLPHQGKRAIMIGVIEDNATDITGNGRLVKVVAIHSM